MKDLNVNIYGVVELSYKEAMEIEGGILLPPIKLITSIISWFTKPTPAPSAGYTTYRKVEYGVTTIRPDGTVNRQDSVVTHGVVVRW